MALSSALKATISLLIIVVVVTVVVVVITVVVVVVVVTVVVVVGIGRSAPTILGQMTNPFAVIAPSVGLAGVFWPFILFGFDCSWKDHLLSFLLPDCSA
ncbi:hypothetical protein Tco_1213688 [Tanacetum coccineum]